VAERVIVVTGASGGIGAAVAEAMAARGDIVVLVARRREQLDAVAERCGRQALAITGDMTDRAEVQRVVREALAAFGRVDVWINNVGRGLTRLPSELSDDDIDEMMRVNVKSALYGMQEILPHFKERGEGQIINVSSILGRIPFAVFRSAYAGAKHFLNALTATLRDELKPEYPGIRISLVSPGVVRTDFGLNALHGGPDSWQRPDAQSAAEVAEVIARLIESDHDDLYTRPGQRQQVLDYHASLGEDP
jgi:NAD(P)-dependent dehydrogenase (short-subunit alcohol dehydrogenase family)